MEMFLCNFWGSPVPELMQNEKIASSAFHISCNERGTAQSEHMACTLERGKLQGSYHIFHWMPRPSPAIYLGIQFCSYSSEFQVLNVLLSYLRWILDISWCMPEMFWTRKTSFKWKRIAFMYPPGQCSFNCALFDCVE